MLVLIFADLVAAGNGARPRPAPEAAAAPADSLELPSDDPRDAIAVICAHFEWPWTRCASCSLRARETGERRHPPMRNASGRGRPPVHPQALRAAEYALCTGRGAASRDPLAHAVPVRLCNEWRHRHDARRGTRRPVSPIVGQTDVSRAWSWRWSRRSRLVEAPGVAKTRLPRSQRRSAAHQTRAVHPAVAQRHRRNAHLRSAQRRVRHRAWSVVANVVLADEINRSGESPVGAPRGYARAARDDRPRDVGPSRPFALATMNPFDTDGTYALPPQPDRRQRAELPEPRGRARSSTASGAADAVLYRRPRSRTQRWQRRHARCTSTIGS